jgi:hypothetical protein
MEDVLKDQPREVEFGFVEHCRMDVAGFSIADTTATGLRPHNDVVWVGRDAGGKWLTPKDALALSEAIALVANSNLARRGLLS